MSITNQKLINPNHASIKQIKAYVPSLLYFGISHNGINEELSNIHKELMTNQEQRAKIEKLLNEIEESATDLTAEQQEAMFTIKALTGIYFDFADNFNESPIKALGELLNDLNTLEHQLAAMKMKKFPSGGIVAEVNRGARAVPGELHGGEFIINKG